MTSSSSLYGPVTTQNTSSTNSTSLYGEAGTPIPDSSGNVVVRGDLIVLSGNILTTAATGNIFPANATTINLGLAATTLNIGASTGSTTINNTLFAPGADFGNITIGVADDQTITTTSDELRLSSVSNAIKLVGTTSLYTDNTGTFNLLNQPTTIFAFRNATTLELGEDTGTTGINNNLRIDGTNINIAQGASFLYSEANNRLNRPTIQSTTGNQSGLRVAAPNTGTSAQALFSVTNSSDINNSEFLQMGSRGSALSNTFRFLTGKYTAGVVGAANKSIAFTDNTNTYATVNPAGPTIGTDLTTKTYVDAIVIDNTTYTIDASTTTGGANFNLVGSNLTTDTIKFAGGINVTVSRTDANTITIDAPVGPNTTYTQNASSVTGGAGLNLVGSDSTTDTVAFKGAGSTVITRTDADTITVTSTDTNTTYTQNISSTTGGANLNLVGSDSTTDTVKFANGTGVAVSYTDASTATIAIGQAVAITDNVAFASVTTPALNSGGASALTVTGGAVNPSIITVDGGETTVALSGGLGGDTAQLTLNSGLLEWSHTAGMMGSVSGVWGLNPNGTTSFPSFTFPYADGSSNQVLRTNGSGILAWYTPADLNTTYTIASGAVTGGANLTLSGSDSSTDSVAYKGAGATTVTSTDANTITITSVDTNTTYTQNASTTTGGANFNLVGSDATTDSIALKGAGATTVTRTDADTVTVTSTDTNTTYTQNASSVTGGAGLNLVGSDSTTDTVSFKGAGATTVTRTDADTVTVTSTDTNTTYAIDASATTGGANLNLTGSDSSTDTVKIDSGTGITVSQTDVNTISVASTITQYTDTQARAAVSNGVDLAVSGTDVYVKSLRDATPVYGALNAMYNQVGYTFQPPVLTTVSGNAGFDIVSSSGGLLGYTASCSLTGYYADTQAGTNASPAIQMRSANGTGTAPTASTLNTVLGTTNYGAYSTTDWASTVATAGQGGGIGALHPLQSQTYSTGTVTDAIATLTPTVVARTQVTVAGVAITGTNGFFSCTAATIGTGNAVVITGTLSGTGTITGYVSGNIYYVVGGNSSTTFQLSATPGGVPIVTTAGTTTGLTFVRYIITVTYAAQTVAPYGTNAKIAVSGITGVTDGTYMAIGTSTTTQVLLGTYTTAVSLGATPLLTIRNVTAAGTGYRVRGFAANTVMNSVNRINFTDHTAAVATYKSDIIAQQSVTPATFVLGTSSISGTTLTVGTLTSGTIAAGSFLTGTGITANTFIVSNVAGAGAGSTWVVSATQTVASTTITGSKQNLITSSVGLSYDRTYGSFYSSATQTNPVSNAENLMIFGSTDIAQGVSIVTNGTTLTRITLARAGVYNIQFSAQLSQTAGGADNAFIWLKKNGTAIAATAGDTRVAGNGDRIMASWNYLVSAVVPGDYYELAWTANGTSVVLEAIAAAGVVPSIPSVILTVVPVGA
jgi:hypothetical protein